MNKRDFLKKSGLGVTGIVLAPSLMMYKSETKNEVPTRLKTAHIGVGNVGNADLNAIEAELDASSN